MEAQVTVEVMGMRADVYDAVSRASNSSAREARTKNPRNLAAMPDSCCDLLLPGELLEGFVDESTDVIGRFRVIHPWQPLPKHLAVRIDCREQRIRMMRLKQAQLGMFVYSNAKHDYD